MADHSTIEWTDATWNPITGCTLVSDGCRYCYAAELAATRLAHHPSRAGLARRNANGEAKFTGEVRFNSEWLDQPLRWRRPRRIFVCAHGDLFHENVPDEWIDRVFAVMALAPRHTFQVLTKRPERARAYFAARKDGDPWAEAADYLADHCGMADHPAVPEPKDVPLPNVWLGTSAEDQATADARIPRLLATPATVRFLSAEPLLGPIDLSAKRYVWRAPSGSVPPFVDWVIVGGESGRHARPMHPEWVRSLRDQCVAAGVPFFFKQWGEWKPISEMEERETDALYHAAPKADPEASRRCKASSCCLHADGSHHNLGEAGRLHSVPAGAFSGPLPMTLFAVGKRAAGRLLDGREWSQMPEARHG